MEYGLKVSMHIRRTHRKYLSVYGDYGKFKVVSSTQNCLPICRKHFKRIRRIRQKNLCVHEEDTERRLVH
jgi:hypothetical protein